MTCRPFVSTIFCLLASVTLAAAEPVVVKLSADATDRDIQNALDRLPEEGGAVQLAIGTYVIHEPIILQRDGQTLSGSGTNTVLTLADHANCPVIILGAPLSHSSRAVSALHLADLFIDGNRRNQERETWKSAPDGSLINNNGVTVWNVKDSLVERVTCCRCRSGGLVCSRGNRAFRVTQFEAYENQYDGLACYETENSLFDHMFLHDNRAAGISLDLSFNHNFISHSRLMGNDLGIFMRESNDNVFQTLTISHSRNHGIFMAQAGSDTPQGWRLMPATACTGNRFIGLTISDSGGKAFLVNDDSCTHNTITDAHFQDNSKGGLAQAVPNLVTLSGLK